MIKPRGTVVLSAGVLAVGLIGSMWSYPFLREGVGWIVNYFDSGEDVGQGVYSVWAITRGLDSNHSQAASIILDFDRFNAEFYYRDLRQSKVSWRLQVYPQPRIRVEFE